jgi:stage II sporulation protein M
VFAAGALSELVKGYFYRHLPLYIALIILFSMGVGFGALATQKLSPPQRADLVSYLSNIYSSLTQEDNPVINRGQIVRQGMMDNIVKTTGLMWVLGLTVIGAPAILGVVFLRGFVLGFTVGFLVQEMVFNGFILSTSSVLPHNLLVVPAVLLGAGGALSFAASAFKTLIGISKENIYGQFATTTLLALCSCGLLGLAAFVETYITPIFVQLTRGFLV